jgi:hypothetical protein
LIEVEPYEADDLKGRPCKVRHIAAKFQEVVFDVPAGHYGLVILGYSLKPFGALAPLGQSLFGLIDNARTVVLENTPARERAASQIPQIQARPTVSLRCTIDITLDDCQIAGSPYARRRLIVLDPARVAA